MKGLLVKDMRFLMAQKTSLFIFVGLALFFMVTGNDVEFAVGYCVLLSAIFATSSISYDMFENGMAFLMTLPVQRKTYVLSKYILSVFMILVMGGIVIVVGWGMNGFSMQAELLKSMLAGFAVSAAMGLFLASIMIPIYIKFGSEKARFAVIILAGIVAVVSFVIARLFAMVDEAKWNAIFAKLQTISEIQAGLGIGATVILCTIISILISNRILEKKEF